jgi:hypothetical protein
MHTVRACLILGCVLVAILCTGACSWAGHYVYTPPVSDMYDLAHPNYYAWGFKVNVPAGERITDAELRIKNITNSEEPETRDHLWIRLIDTPPTTGGSYAGTTNNYIRTFTDNENYVDDTARWGGPLVANYSDNNGRLTTENLHYSMASMGLLSTFANYASTNRVGFAFDPDCHYTNDGVCLTVTTSSVPEPCTLALMLAGAGPTLGMVARRRRRRASA